MNDSKLREQIRQACMVTIRPVGSEICSISQKQTDQVMTLFTQALTARLDAVAGALPEKRILPSEHGDYPLKNKSKDYCIGFNEALDGCHAAIDTVREGL